MRQLVVEFIRAAGRTGLLLGALCSMGCSSDTDDGAPSKTETTPDTTPDTTSACPGVPEFSLNMEAEGRDGVMKAVLISASPAPPVLKTNDWVVEFRDLNDELLTDVEIKMVQPFMPEHGHDGTFAPTVVAGGEPGQFEVDDINLWMPGVWEVRFTVESASLGADYVVFETCISE